VVAGVISVARARQGLRKPRPLDVPCTHDRYSTQTRFRATVNQMVFDYGSIKFRVGIFGRMCLEGAKDINTGRIGVGVWTIEWNELFSEQ